MSLSQRLCLLPLLALSLSHAQSSSTLSLFMLENAVSWSSAYDCAVDNAARSITLEVSYGTRLDSLRFAGMKAIDQSTPKLYDQAGQLLPQHSYLKLDASLKAQFKVVSEDGSNQAPYTLSILRKSPSTSTKPYSLQLADDASNYAAVFDFDTESYIDSAQGIIHLKLSSIDPLNLSRFHVHALTSQYEPMPVLLAPGDTLPHSLTLQDTSLHSFTAYTFKDCLYCIDSLEHTVTFRLAPEDTLDLRATKLSAMAKDGNGMILLGPDSAVLADYYPMELDSLGRFSFYVKAQDGTLQAYTLQFRLPAAEDPERLSPALVPTLGDWRLALAASHGVASLYALSGRLLWSAPLPQSLEAVESRRRAYALPLILRIGSSQWLLPIIK